jgi:hypothetical protein
MAKTPTAALPHSLSRPPPMPVLLDPNSQSSRIPLLPRIASSPGAAGQLRRLHAPPALGSLAAVLHPQLGPAHVCRVLGRRLQNGTENFLVAFFQAEHSPCFVPREFLFQLDYDAAFSLDDDAEFKSLLEREDFSVDVLLEKIFSAGQVLAINQAEVLFPPDQVQQAAIKPTAEQVQQTMFQCVTCAALLVVSYVASRCVIPEEKLRIVIDTIFKTNPPKFASTQLILMQAQQSLTDLLLLQKE